VHNQVCAALVVGNNKQSYTVAGVLQWHFWHTSIRLLSDFCDLDLFTSASCLLSLCPSLYPLG